MLVSRFAYECAVYGGLVAIVASAWVAIRHRERRVEPKLPPATTGRSFRRYVARIAPVIVLLALLGGEWALLSHSYDAIVVERGPTARRAVFVGELTARGPGDTLLVNHSDQVLEFLQGDYGDYQERYRIDPHAETRIPEPRPGPSSAGGPARRATHLADLGLSYRRADVVRPPALAPRGHRRGRARRPLARL